MVRLHVTRNCILGVMFTDSSLTSVIYIIITIIISLSIHESVHALVSYKLGDTTAQDMGRLSLNPLKHIDPYTTLLLPIITVVLFGVPVLAARPVPFNPLRVKFHEFGVALVAVAGPLSNLLLAIIGALVLRSMTDNISIINFLVTFVKLNVVLFVFNLIPIPPLDGSRVLYAFAPEPVQELMRKIEPYGLFIIFGLVLSGVLTSLLLHVDNSVLQLLP